MRTTPSPLVASVLAALAALSGCGKQGDPLPPLRRAPQPVAGLSVAQRGGVVVVSYQAPRANTDGSKLGVLSVELLRADREGDFAAVAQSKARSVAPGELIAETEPLPAPGTVLRFAARARAKRQLSQLVSAPPLTVTAPPSRPSALLVKPGVVGLRLDWTPPADAVAPTFWVYRREKAGRFGRPLNPTPVAGASYDDASANSGEEYCYVVRRVAQTSPVVESAPSEEVCGAARDVTPPAAPLGAAAFVDETGATVSWSPSPEPDLDKYRVYLHRPGGRGQLLVELPAGETSYKDQSGVRRRVYVVVAVDKAGNESAPSEPIEARQP